MHACPFCESEEVWPVNRADDRLVDDIRLGIAMTCDDCGASFSNSEAIWIFEDADEPIEGGL